MQKQTKAPTWQRVVSGLLCIASAALMAAEIFGALPGALHHTARQLLEAYTAYAFGQLALKGRLSNVLQSVNR